jgi:peptidoglycan/LPS O-acetylase OafA/YrhL
MRIENRSSQWRFNLPETLAMLIVAVVTVIVIDKFGFIYGLAFAIIGGVSAGLAIRFTRSKWRYSVIGQKPIWWPLESLESCEKLVFVIGVAVVVFVGQTVGFFYGLAVAVVLGGVLGLIFKRRKEKQRNG